MKRSASFDPDDTTVATPKRRQRDGRKMDEVAIINLVDHGNEVIDEVTTQAVVTPSTLMKRHRSGHYDHVEHENVRRALFPATISRGAVAVTPSRSEKVIGNDISTSVVSKRKLIFGRSVLEIEVNKNVRHVYSIIKKLTGSIGGNGSFGPIYGELTMGSMQKMIGLMKEHTELNTTSRFIDVGSGIGKPNLHVAQDPGVEFSYGIEVEADRWLLGMNCLKSVLDAASEQEQQCSVEHSGTDKLFHNCLFEHGDITDAHTLDPFTHVYMFSIGFPPKLWHALSKMWNRSASLYLICYHGPKHILQKYEFDVELIIQMPTSMHGSKEGHMGYIYQRKSRIVQKQATPECDPYFESALDIVHGDFNQLHQYVISKVSEQMNFEKRRTRSQQR
jgi:Histone methylation protein DOT1